MKNWGKQVQTGVRTPRLRPRIRTPEELAAVVAAGAERHRIAALQSAEAAKTLTESTERLRNCEHLARLDQWASRPFTPRRGR